MGFCTQLGSEGSELMRLRCIFLIAVLMVHSHVDGNVKCIFTVSIKNYRQNREIRLKRSAVADATPGTKEGTCQYEILPEANEDVAQSVPESKWRLTNVR